MIDAHIDDNTEAAEKYVLDAGWEGLVRATKFLLGLIDTALSVPARINKKGPDRYQGAAPGDPPRFRTGHGRASVTDDYDEPNLITRVGLQPGAKYMLYLELGTEASVSELKSPRLQAFNIGGKKIYGMRTRVNRPALAARPWLVATVKKFFSELQEMAGSGAEETKP